MKRRHRARRLALQALSCLDVQGLKARPLAEGFIQESRDPPETRRGAMDLLAEAIDDREASDRLVAQHARHWGLDRMPVVDRNILRLAVSELSRGRTPPKVVITEALLLAKEFSSAESPRFINGVLDSIAKQIAPQADLAYSPPPKPHHPPTQDAKH